MVTPRMVRGRIGTMKQAAKCDIYRPVTAAHAHLLPLTI
jgi:hypothetical protein